MQQAPVDAVAACSKVECHPARRLHGHIPHWAPLCGSSVTTTALVTMARHAMDVSNADASFRTQYVSRHSRGYAPHPQHSLQAWLGGSAAATALPSSALGVCTCIYFADQRDGYAPTYFPHGPSPA